MRAKSALFAMLSTGLAWAQEPTVSRVFKLHHVQTDQDVSEFATLLRTIAEVPQLNADRALGTISLSGSPQQIALAEWVFNELDRATLPKIATGEYHAPGSPDDVTRVFFAPNAASIQGFQEIATSVRTIAEIRRVFTYNSVRALAVRGTADQVSAAAWMVQELDQPPDAKRTDSAVHKIIDVSKQPGTDVRVFYAPYASTVQQFQEIATMVRTIGDTRRVFTYNLPRAVIVRGTSDEIALAGWMIHELGKPASTGTASETYQYVDSGNHGEDKVRVFYIKDAGNVQTFQQVATQIRTTTKIRRVFTYNASLAMAVRGTTEQLAEIEQMLQDRQLASK